MRNSNSSTARALSILDVLDEHGFISAQLLLDQGAARSSVYRDITALVDAGLLARGRQGSYVAGPRYLRQTPGTSFDKEARMRRVAEEARRLKAEAETKMTVKTIAERLGYSAAMIRRMLKEAK